MAKYFNVTGSGLAAAELTQELLAAGDNISVNEISLSNVHKSKTCQIDLYIEKKLTGRFYLLKAVKLPIGTTLSVSTGGLSSATGEYGLYIKLTAAATFALTGTIDPAASVTVPGSGTAFLTEITIGDEIVVSGETRIVTSIESGTSLTVSTAFSNNGNDATPDCNPVAPVDVILF